MKRLILIALLLLPLTVAAKSRIIDPQIKSLQAVGGGRGILSIAGAGGMGEAIALELVK